MIHQRLLEPRAFDGSHVKENNESSVVQVSSQGAAHPPAAKCIHYLDFPAGRIDTGSVCTSASDILLEPRPLKKPPNDCLFSILLKEVGSLAASPPLWMESVSAACCSLQSGCSLVSCLLPFCLLSSAGGFLSLELSLLFWLTGSLSAVATGLSVEFNVWWSGLGAISSARGVGPPLPLPV